MTPSVRFYRFIDNARAPQRADRTAIGTLPIRAARYCDAISSATAFGWWLFCPVDCWVLYDGISTFWKRIDGTQWLPLADACHFPGFPQTWDTEVPPELVGMCPPFLTATQEHGGILQVQFGLMVRAAPGWGLLIRRPANFPLMTHVEHFEGIIEPESWFGPLFINVRITQTNTPIRLRADLPFAQMQPLPCDLYSDATLADAKLASPTLAQFGAAEWADYLHRVAEPNTRPRRQYGTYAVENRKRRKGNAAATIASCPAYSSAKDGGPA